jgi:cytochrome c
MIDRDAERRLLMLRDRKCRMCRKVDGFHMHEIVTRGMTMGNETARNLSFSRFICSWLCADCHEEAHNGAMAYELLLQNCVLYGYDRVRGAYEAVEEAMGTTIPLTFPTKEEVDVARD